MPSWHSAVGDEGEGLGVVVGWLHGDELIGHFVAEVVNNPDGWHLESELVAQTYDVVVDAVDEHVILCETHGDKVVLLDVFKPMATVVGRDRIAVEYCVASHAKATIYGDESIEVDGHGRNEDTRTT